MKYTKDHIKNEYGLTLQNKESLKNSKEKGWFVDESGYWYNTSVGRLRTSFPSLYVKNSMWKENIKTYLSNIGCDLISVDHKNHHYNLCLVGSCGHEFKMRLNKLKSRKYQNGLCQECHSKHFENNFEVYKEKYETIGVDLLKRYKENGRVYVEFIGVCGHHVKRHDSGNIKANRNKCYDCYAKEGNLYNETVAERNKTEWIEIPCDVYLMKLYNDEESFYKIGISINLIGRVKDINKKYKVEVLTTIKTNLYNAVCIESDLHLINKKYKYTPKIKFGGYTECFYKLSKGVKSILKERGDLDG